MAEPCQPGGGVPAVPGRRVVTGKAIVADGGSFVVDVLTLDLGWASFSGVW